MLYMSYLSFSLGVSIKFNVPSTRSSKNEKNEKNDKSILNYFLPIYSILILVFALTKQLYFLDLMPS
jgi:hypothetical protein